MWSPIALPDFMGYVLVISIDWMWTRMELFALQYRCHVLFQCSYKNCLGAIRVVTSQLGFARPFSIRCSFDEEMLFQLSKDAIGKPALR